MEDLCVYCNFFHPYWCDCSEGFQCLEHVAPFTSFLLHTDNRNREYGKAAHTKILSMLHPKRTSTKRAVERPRHKTKECSQCSRWQQAHSEPSTLLLPISQHLSAASRLFKLSQGKGRVPSSSHPAVAQSTCSEEGEEWQRRGRRTRKQAHVHHTAHPHAHTTLSSIAL